jgi:hypothetical protein
VPGGKALAPAAYLRWSPDQPGAPGLNARMAPYRLRPLRPWRQCDSSLFLPAYLTSRSPPTPPRGALILTRLMWLLPILISPSSVKAARKRDEFLSPRLLCLAGGQPAPPEPRAGGGGLPRVSVPSPASPEFPPGRRLPSCIITAMGPWPGAAPFGRPRRPFAACVLGEFQAPIPGGALVWDGSDWQTGEVY